MSWKENKAVRLFTPAQAELDNKPDINDLLLLGQAALTHGTAGHGIAVSSTGPLSHALPLPPSTSSFLMAPSTMAATTTHQSLLAVAVAAPPPPPLVVKRQALKLRS